MGDIFIQNVATNGTGTVGAVSSTIVAANVNRQSFYIANDSGTVVYVSLSATAIKNQGIRLAAAGSSGSVWEMDRDNLYVGAISAINSGSGTVNVTYVEK